MRGFVPDQVLDKLRESNRTAEETGSLLRSSLSGGISEKEAENRLLIYGLNELPEKKPVSSIGIFINQFTSLIVAILLAAAVISLILREWENAAVILAIILLNAVLGFMQEYHAEQSLSALRKLFAPACKVIREDRLQTIPASKIVPGDLLVFEEGDRVPADGRIVRAFQFQTQEAALTGESMPVKKNPAPLNGENIPLGDRKNMVFMGTSVTSGKAYVLVTATGQRTELGKIALTLQAVSPQRTPLELKLDDLGKRLVYLVLGIAAIVFLLGILRGYGFISMFLVAMTLAVAAIPEGLPAVVTIALAFGVKRMAKRNALVRRLASVETLGCATAICTDKTGTLTKNEMTVRSVWAGGMLFEVTGSGYEPAGAFLSSGKQYDPRRFPALMETMKIAALCNGAKLFQKDGIWQMTGDPTEAALLALSAKGGCSKESIERDFPLIEELPFDSERKRMSVLRGNAGSERLYVKGAPDVVLHLCDRILMNGEETVLTQEKRAELLKICDGFAAQALRVLAAAGKPAPLAPFIESVSERGLVFTGLIAMMDPPRPEAKASIETCRKAGIRTLMITGDHKETATAIAAELGLIEKNGGAMTGAEIEALDDEALSQAVKRFSVFARVTAAHKFRIVKALRKNGEIVAMTGDGVNDAPAVKEADIGVAMGLTGTDVTKEASDMVITDDNFSSIVQAVEEGRGIYNNILKFVSYLVSHNLAEIFVLFIGMLAGFRDLNGVPFIPLLAVQILWMNLVTDGLPALALSLDASDPEAMKRPPRKPSDPVLSPQLLILLTVSGVIMAAGALVFCVSGLRHGPDYARSMTLTALVFLQAIPVQMIRTTQGLSFFSNPWILAALGISYLLQIAVLYVPFMQKIFSTVPLNLQEWPVLALIGISVWILTRGASLALDSFSKKKIF